jgi:glycosyltransferase involved in cell wall biosynthesis
MPRPPSSRGVAFSPSIPDVTTSWPHLPVCLVAPLYPPAMGGVERYVERLAAGLRDRGIPVEIVATDPAASAPSVEVRDGIPVRRFPTVRGDRLFYPSPGLARWLRHGVDGYALLHAHNLHTLLPLTAAWAARPAATPVVLTAHWHGTGHTPVRRLLHVPYRPVAGRVVRGARAIIGNSEGEAALLRRDFGERLPITVIPEGIELPVAGPVDAGGADPDGQTGATTILSVGRLEPYKGVERVVAAMADLPASYRLVIVGEGPARDAIEHAASVAGVADRVVLRGRVPDEELAAWYERAAVFISLSGQESFGLAVLEAAAAGMPVVASDIPAHGEATSFVPAGRITLVAGGSDGREIAAAIRSGLAQGRANDRTGWALPSWDDLVERTVAVYRGVLAGRPISG